MRVLLLRVLLRFLRFLRGVLLDVMRHLRRRIEKNGE